MYKRKRYRPVWRKEAAKRMGEVMGKAKRNFSGYKVATQDLTNSDEHYEEYLSNKMAEEDKGEQAFDCD